MPIVSTIQDRGYVEQQDRKFTPTWLGETVNELMIKHFPDIVDANFTAEMERKLDDVEEGKQCLDRLPRRLLYCLQRAAGTRDE